MKAIVIGASLSGKTSIKNYLREKSNILVSEMDEELTILNKNIFPEDTDYKHDVLAPQVIKNILSKESIIFFTNTDYFSDQDLKEARQIGFKIIQLNVNLELLKNRNKTRVINKGYDDLTKYLSGMVDYQTRIQKKGFVDKIINSDLLSVQEIGEEILKELE
jgi:hypothetical protein